MGGVFYIRLWQGTVLRLVLPFKVDNIYINENMQIKEKTKIPSGVRIISTFQL